MDRFDFEKTKSKDFKKWANPKLGNVGRGSWSLKRGGKGRGEED
jgi:hypothetical protein